MNVMTNAPRVSVIIPTHNCGTYLADAIESVLAQSFTSYDIIVVDDGSTDGTRSLLAPYAGIVGYLYQEHRGAAAARNAGIAQSCGKYVAFLDADDVWLPMKLELQVQALEAHPEAGLAFTDFLNFDASGVTTRSRLGIQSRAKAWFEGHRVADTAIACGTMYQDLLPANWIHTSSVVVRRDVLQVAGPFDTTFTIGEDYDLWLRIARHYPLLCVNSVLSGYHYRPQSACGPMESRAFRSHRGILEVLKKHLRNQWIPRELLGLVRRQLGKRYWALGWSCFGEDRFTEARQFLSQGIRYQPFNRQLWMYWCASFLPLSAIESVRRVRQWRRNHRIPAEPAARNLSITPSGPEGPHAAI